MGTYKEKYEKALERARISRLQLLDIGEEATEIEHIFPELRESEDEKNRKRLIEYLKFSLKGAEEQDEAGCNRQKDIEAFKWGISWLEKQGKPKEKPTKKQVWDYCNKISSEWWQISMDKWNTLTDEDKNKYNQFIGFNDFSDTLMNITAGALFQLIDTGKLEYEEGSLLLEKPDDTPKPLEVTNAMNEKQVEKKLAESISQLTIQGKGFYKICPYCKERMVRDDSKVYTSMPPQYEYNCPKCGTMEFDTVMYDNPEMEEQKPTDKVEPKFEDERMFSGLISIVEGWYNTMSEEEKEYYGDCGYVNWLNSIKDRVQPKQEWSKDDKKQLDRAIYMMEQLGMTKSWDDVYNWLKSLKPQKHWKPSEEQMSMLTRVCSNLHLRASMDADRMDEFLDELKTLCDT